MMIRKLVISAILLAASVAALSAQEVIVPSGYDLVDSLVYKPAAAVDSALVGKNVFSLLPSKSKGSRATVNVHQSEALASAVAKTISSNSSRTLSGYRVRIFFDNKQNSRSASETAVSRFKSMFPGIAAYRTYSNPFFKVTVGDFRTKSEAMQMLGRLKSEFPTAFVVRENINYPVVDRRHAYVADTVLVMRQVVKQ